MALVSVDPVVRQRRRFAFALALTVIAVPAAVLLDGDDRPADISTVVTAIPIDESATGTNDGYEHGHDATALAGMGTTPPTMSESLPSPPPPTTPTPPLPRSRRPSYRRSARRWV